MGPNPPPIPCQVAAWNPTSTKTTVPGGCMGPDPTPDTERPGPRMGPGRSGCWQALLLLLVVERLVLVAGVPSGVDVDQVAAGLGVGPHRDLVGGAVLGVVDVVAVGLVGVDPVGGGGDLGQDRGDAAVARHAGPGRDQLADDDVLLEAD